MDKKIANNLIVGFLFAGGFVGLVFILFNIGGGGFLQSRYTLLGKFSDVKGLHMGSEVALSGLRVGVVRNLEVTDIETGEITVKMLISRNVDKFIRTDSIAAIKTQGVLGDKYVEISIGSTDHPLLEDGAFIPTAQPEDLFSKSGKVVDGISKQFRSGGGFDSLVGNLNKVAENLAVVTADLKRGKSGKTTSRSLEHLENILRKVDKGEGSLGALVNDPSIYEDIKAMTGGAKRSSVLKYFMRQFIQEGNDVQRDAESIEDSPNESISSSKK